MEYTLTNFIIDSLIEVFVGTAPVLGVAYLLARSSAAMKKKLAKGGNKIIYLPYYISNALFLFILWGGFYSGFNIYWCKRIPAGVTASANLTRCDSFFS